MDPQAQPTPVSAATSRGILYKLRDLDLRSERLRLAGGLRVELLGCLESGAPVSERVHYRLRVDGTERLFTIDLGAAHLRLALSPPLADGLAGLNGTPPERSRHLALTLDETGRPAVPEVGRGFDPRCATRDEVESFLRRLVVACLPVAG